MRKLFMRAAARRGESVADWMFRTCCIHVEEQCGRCGGPTEKRQCRACGAEDEVARLREALDDAEGRIARLEVDEPKAEAPPDRKDVLLRAAYDLMVGTNEFGMGIDTNGVKVLCEGFLIEPDELKNDLAEALGLPDGAEPLKGAAA